MPDSSIRISRNVDCIIRDLLLHPVYETTRGSKDGQWQMEVDMLWICLYLDLCQHVDEFER